MTTINEFALYAMENDGKFLVIFYSKDGRRHAVIDSEYCAVELSREAQDFIGAYGLKCLKVNRVYQLDRLAMEK